jgi:hypothetical protein
VWCREGVTWTYRVPLRVKRGSQKVHKVHQRKAHSERVLRNDDATSKRVPRGCQECVLFHRQHSSTHLTSPNTTPNMTTICALNVPTLLARSTTAKRDVRANAKKAGGVAAAVPKAGQKYANVAAAVDAGLIQAVAPGFFNDIDQAEAQRYADVEITHGRLAMLASVGFIVGESVEGSSFLFGTYWAFPKSQHCLLVLPL